MNALVVYHIGSGHAFFSGISLIQLAGLSAFLRRGRWLAFCRMASACAGVILVAVSHGVLLVPKRVLIGVLTSEGATLDTVHLSPRGHALMAETVWDIIGQAIGP